MVVFTNLGVVSLFLCVCFVSCFCHFRTNNFRLTFCAYFGNKILLIIHFYILILQQFCIFWAIELSIWERVVYCLGTCSLLFGNM